MTRLAIVFQGTPQSNTLQVGGAFLAKFKEVMRNLLTKFELTYLRLMFSIIFQEYLGGLHPCKTPRRQCFNLFGCFEFDLEWWGS